MLACQASWGKPFILCVLLEIPFTQQIVLKHLFYEGARLEPELRVTVAKGESALRTNCLPSVCLVSVKHSFHLQLRVHTPSSCNSPLSWLGSLQLSP